MRCREDADSRVAYLKERMEALKRKREGKVRGGKGEAKIVKGKVGKVASAEA
jgi:hypothetical protein